MKCTTLVSLLTVAAVAPMALGAEYLVGVGKDETTGKKGKGFDPSVIHPQVGDVIAFEFQGGQHSVVQSSFDNPCTPSGGIDTGVQTVDDSLPVDAPGLPQIRVTINSTEPIWFFDQAGGLCNKGAVLAVNPSSTQTAAAFVDNASKAPPAPPSTSSAGSSSTETGSGTSPTQTSPAPSTTSNAAVAMIGDVRSALALGLLSLLAVF